MNNYQHTINRYIHFIFILSILLIISSSILIDRQVKYELEVISNSELNLLYNDEVNKVNNLTLLVDVKNIEISNLNNAIETALTDNLVIQTLLNKDMEEWTPEGILRMRDELASLPYGSPFAGGHIVTAPWGSTELTGTYWKNAHPGVDIYPKSGNNNEPVLSPIDGKVVTWGRNDRVYGNYLVIESLDGKYQLTFAHLSAIAIVEGRKVDLFEGMTFKAGQQIARMGKTGMATGYHLHIEYRIYELQENLEYEWRLLNASAILDYIGTSKETIND